MESDLQQINLIVLISTIGPLIASVLAIIAGIKMDDNQTLLSRTQYFARIICMIFIGITFNFLVKILLGLSERAMQQFDTDEIIPRLWALAIISILVSIIVGYFLGRFTSQRNSDMGKPKKIAYTVIFTPAILYFLLASPRQSSALEAMPDAANHHNNKDQPSLRPVSKKYYGWILSLITIFVIWLIAGQVGKFIGSQAVKVIGSSPQSTRSESSRAKELSDAMANAAAEIRRTTPEKLDDVTTIVTASNTDTSLIYHYRIELPVSEINKDLFLEGMTPKLVDGVCGNANMKLAVEHGGKFSYRYTSKDDIIIGEIVVGKESCDQ